MEIPGQAGPYLVSVSTKASGTHCLDLIFNVFEMQATGVSVLLQRVKLLLATSASHMNPTSDPTP